MISFPNRLAAYLEAAPAREAALSKQQQEKYAKLERMLGRQPKSRSDFEEAANKLDEAGEELEGEGSASPDADRGEGGSGSKGEGSAKFVPVRGKEASSSGVKPVAGGKHRFDDTEYLEQSREIVDNVRSAVASGECFFCVVGV